jgi:pimeloyl-ACP methyl ester carboxylesterase
MPRLLLILLCFCATNVQADYSREYIDQQVTLHTQTPAGVNIAYQVIGSPAEPAVVLIMGLGASHALWGDAFVQGIRQAGYRVILLDNRDVGASSRFTAWGEPTLWWELLKNQLGFAVNAPYLLADMADDVIAVMDTLEIQKAHIVGASMGGMIAQIVAARYPQRTQSLVSIMSTTGAPHLPPPSGASADMLNGLADGDAAEAQITLMKARGFYPEAIPRQLLAIIKTGDRSMEVAGITAPTLVLHGADDTLLPPAHGEHTATLIQGATLKIFTGMGHDLPEPVLPGLLSILTQHLQAHGSLPPATAPLLKADARPGSRSKIPA